MTTPGPPLLTVAGLSVRYGSQLVVSDVDLEVGRGEVVGLIGANGAGKTTTFDAISGFVDHGGSVRFDGRELSGLAPDERARCGVGRTWQGVELFDDLTVGQNCLVAARSSAERERGRTVTRLVADLLHRPDSDVVAEQVRGALAAVGLTDAADVLPSELSHGHQKLAGVARALAAAPSLVLLDEPAAGLDQSESLAFGRTIRSLIDDSGISALLIDHDTGLIFDVCDRVYVLDVGVVVASGSVDDVRRDPRVIEAYLGVNP